MYIPNKDDIFDITHIFSSAHTPLTSYAEMQTLSEADVKAAMSRVRRPCRDALRGKNSDGAVQREARRMSSCIFIGIPRLSCQECCIPILEDRPSKGTVAHTEWQRKSMIKAVDYRVRHSIKRAVCFRDAYEPALRIHILCRNLEVRLLALLCRSSCKGYILYMWAKSKYQQKTRLLQVYLLSAHLRTYSKSPDRFAETQQRREAKI